MSNVIHLIPVAIAALLWFGLYRLNQTRSWFRIGELIFWDAIILIAVFLVWLQWF